MIGPARRQRLAAVGLVLLFAVPALLAWLLLAGDWRPMRTTNHGTFFSPIRPVSTVGLEARDGRALGPGFFERKWTVVLVGPAPCEAACLDALYRIRQSRLALGKDVDRVQRLYVTPRESAGREENPSAFQPEHEGLRLARASGDWLAQLAVDGAPPSGGYRIYVIDPRSHLIMHYPPDVDAKHLLEDLERLLDVSRIG